MIHGSISPYIEASGTMHTPRIEDEVFVASGAQIIGNVTLEKQANVWYHAVIRGDVNSIAIGKETNIQDGAVIHGDSGEGMVQIGARVTVGHNAVIHACRLKDECLIGMGATILNGAIVESNVLVAAGALVPPKMRLEQLWLYAGIPAKPIRRLTSDELAHFKISAHNYVELARCHVLSMEHKTHARER